MTSNLVLRSIGRVLWFAVAGAFCMALTGIIVGAPTSAFLMFVFNMTHFITTRRPFRDVGTSALMGAAYLCLIGFLSGGVAFSIAGCFACLSAFPRKVFGEVWGLAWRAAIVSVILGEVLGIINNLLLNRLTHATSLNDWTSGYVFGLTGGFVIGTFYGAIIGAKRELARQKLEQKNVLLPENGSRT